jgi:dihydrofolate reductase
LIGRENIIVTRNKNLKLEFDNVIILHSLDESIGYCKDKNYEKIFIIGGGEIYNQGIHLADEMILSHLKFEAEGEIEFPEINEDEWKIVSTEEKEQFEIVKYVKADG